MRNPVVRAPARKQDAAPEWFRARARNHSGAASDQGAKSFAPEIPTLTEATVVPLPSTG